MLKRAVCILQGGGVVAFPTETVYGLGGDARQERAVRRIFTLKKRPFDHPLIVHLAHPDQVSEWGKNLSSAFHALAKRFWPGALTLIVEKHDSVLDVVTGGQNTVGLRIPRHPVALDLLSHFGGGIAAPSANVFTHISPTTKEAVYAEFGDEVDLILEGGECEVGLESTIVDVSGKTISVLRPGMITQHDIENVLNETVSVGYHQLHPDVRVSGMHRVHYAPRTKTLLCSRSDIQNIFSSKKRIGFIGHGESLANETVFAKTVYLSNDAQHYAHDLYRVLRELDDLHLDEIWIESVPESEAWEAIRDRLGKASGILT